MDTSIRKYTAIWQSLKPKQVNRVQETFGDWISEHIFDNKHEVVLDNAILFDTFIYFRSRLLRAFSRKNAFLVHFQDETYAGQYQLYENFRGVSRNYWSSIFNPAIRAHNSACYTEPSASAASNQKRHREAIRQSFLGQTNKSSRPDMSNRCCAFSLISSFRQMTLLASRCSTRQQVDRGAILPPNT